MSHILGYQLLCTCLIWVSLKEGPEIKTWGQVVYLEGIPVIWGRVRKIRQNREKTLWYVCSWASTAWALGVQVHPGASEELHRPSQSCPLKDREPRALTQWPPSALREDPVVPRSTDFHKQWSHTWLWRNWWGRTLRQRSQEDACGKKPQMCLGLWTSEQVDSREGGRGTGWGICSVYSSPYLDDKQWNHSFFVLHGTRYCT